MEPDDWQLQLDSNGVMWLAWDYDNVNLQDWGRMVKVSNIDPDSIESEQADYLIAVDKLKTLVAAERLYVSRKINDKS